MHTNVIATACTKSSIFAVLMYTCVPLLDRVTFLAFSKKANNSGSPVDFSRAKWSEMGYISKHRGAINNSIGCLCFFNGVRGGGASE